MTTTKTFESHEHEEARHQLVMEQTGVTEFDITTALHTFNEIARSVDAQEGYLGMFSTRENIANTELQSALIRATLLQAAQLKRIADALENIAEGSVLVSAKGG